MKANLWEPAERLGPDECWELLGLSTVGRLAVVVDDAPDIFPVNFVLDGSSIVFRTAPGTKYWGTLRKPCALETDGYDAATGQAWSVVVKGHAELIADPDAQTAVDALHLEPWQAGDKYLYIRLLHESVTGRRFATTEPDVWTTPTTDARTERFH